MQIVCTGEELREGVGHDFESLGLATSDMAESSGEDRPDDVGQDSDCIQPVALDKGLGDGKIQGQSVGMGVKAPVTDGEPPAREGFG